MFKGRCQFSVWTRPCVLIDVLVFAEKVFTGVVDVGGGVLHFIFATPTDFQWTLFVDMWVDRLLSSGEEDGQFYDGHP